MDLQKASSKDNNVRNEDYPLGGCMFVHLCFHLFHHCAVRAIGTLQRDDSCQWAWPSRIKISHVSLVFFVSSVRMFLDCFDFCCLLWFCCLTYFLVSLLPLKLHIFLNTSAACLLAIVFSRKSLRKRGRRKVRNLREEFPLLLQSLERGFGLCLFFFQSSCCDLCI